MIAVALGRVAHHTGTVRGPRAANRMGQAVAPGAVVQQTCQTMASLSQGLCHSRAAWDDLATLTGGSPSQRAAPPGRRGRLATTDAPPLDQAARRRPHLDLIRAYAGGRAAAPPIPTGRTRLQTPASSGCVLPHPWRWRWRRSPSIAWWKPGPMTRRRRGVSGLPVNPVAWAMPLDEGAEVVFGRDRRWLRRGSSRLMSGPWSGQGYFVSGAGRMRVAQHSSRLFCCCTVTDRIKCA
jgi:hypothetical protein